MAGDLPPGMVGDLYHAQLMADGGTYPYQWTIDACPLPSGLQLDTQRGTIWGVPEREGDGATPLTRQIAVRVTDSAGTTAGQLFSLTINPALAVSTDLDLGPGDDGEGFIAKLRCTGGAEPYKWEILRHGWPAGLILNPDTGGITGTPTSIGTTLFTARVMDRVGHTAKADFSIKVSPASFWRHPLKWSRREPGHTKMTRLWVTVRSLSSDNPAKKRQYFPWGTGNPTFYLTMFVAVSSFGILFVALSTGSMVGATVGGIASFMIGGLAGVLFGIPRYAASSTDKQATQPHAVRYQGNTNLEQVSDWLTKIIIGVTLTEFRSIARDVVSVSNSLAASFSGVTNIEGRVEAMSLLLLAAISGFLFFYLWARVYLPKMFRDSETDDRRANGA
jgi:hypothetical protein